MRRGATAASIGTVDEVVVDQRCRVEELQGAGGVEYRPEFSPGIAAEVERSDCAVPEHREARAEALAARDIRPGLVEKRRCIGSKGLKFGSVCGDRVSDALLNKPCESLRMVHAA